MQKYGKVTAVTLCDLATKSDAWSDKHRQEKYVFVITPTMLTLTEKNFRVESNFIHENRLKNHDFLLRNIRRTVQSVLIKKFMAHQAA
jgi:hypothetical protein